MSRFRTDHLVLPDTDAAAAAVASSLNAVPDGAQDFLLPPSVRSALAEAEARQQLQAMGGGRGLAAAGAPGQQLQQPQQDAAGAADAFLTSLSDMLGGPAATGAAGEAAPPLPTEPPPPQQQTEEEEAAAAAADAERPVDLFKAIFEDSEEEEDEEEEQARPS